MAISTSGFANVLLRASGSIALLFAGGCDPAGSTSNQSVRNEPQPKPELPARAEVHIAATQRAKPVALYAADLVMAVAGAKKVPFPVGVAGIGGMECSLASLRRTDRASRAFTITLPADAAARRHVLAAVTPARGLLEIYTPYAAEAAEAGDLIIPSQAISWAKARTQYRFAVDTDDLDGLRPGATTAEILFLEPGRYRFALINGMDSALLNANGASVRVTAACSVDWGPQEAGSGGAS